MNALPFALSTLRAHWKLIGAAFLLLALITQTFRLSATEGALSAEKAGRQADLATYEKVQAQATADALSAKLKKDAENAQKAEQADQRYADLRARYDSRLRAKAAQREAGSADMSISTESAESSDGPGRGAVFPVGTILIPEDDAFICATNTARLQAVREWALSLSQP